MTTLSRPDHPLVSLILPAMNEEENIRRCHEEISAAMAGADCDYEVLLIDNASTDSTPEKAKTLCAEDERWRYIRFSRNFAVESSMAAGLRYARGDAVVILFSDLQEPPDVIPVFLEKWREGADIVYGVHTARPGESAGRRLGAEWYYKLINALSDVELPVHAADFRLMDRKVVNTLNHLRERNRYLRGLSHWTGFTQAAVPYERRPRAGGESKAPLSLLVAIAFKAICNFSVKPLRLFMFLGLGTGAFACLVAAYNLAVWILWRQTPPGTMMLGMLILIQMAFTGVGIGILGEYVGHVYTETKRRPLWVVDETVNIEIPESERYGE